MAGGSRPTKSNVSYLMRPSMTTCVRSVTLHAYLMAPHRPPLLTQTSAGLWMTCHNWTRWACVLSPPTGSITNSPRPAPPLRGCVPCSRILYITMKDRKNFAFLLDNFKVTGYISSKGAVPLPVSAFGGNHGNSRSTPFLRTKFGAQINILNANNPQSRIERTYSTIRKVWQQQC